MDIITESLKQVPGLALLAFVVITFLKHIASSDAAMRTLHIDLHKEHLDARALSRQAMHATESAIRDNIATRENVISVLKSVEHKLNSKAWNEYK